MSNSDSFIDEVTEAVRRDRLFLLFRRYGWLVLLVIVLIVGGASYREWRKAQQVAAAQALGDAIMTALDAGDAKARIAALDGVDASGEAGALVAMLAAGEDVSAEDRADAAARLQAVAEDATLPVAYRQLATLKMVLDQGSDTPVAERRAALEPLSAPGQPFRPLALEQLALLAAEDGDTDTAIAHLRDVIAADNATAGLRQRAAQLIVALGGSLADGA